MISSKREQLRLRAHRRHRLMASQLRKSLRHLLTRNGIIKWRNGNIATVNNLSPVAVGIDIRTGVEASKGGLS